MVPGDRTSRMRKGFNEQPVGWLTKDYGIHRIDFSNLIRFFFWDTTFLSDHLAKMSRQASRTILIWPETVGLTAGFKTHPDELSLSACSEEITKEFRNQKEASAWSPGCRSYPSVSNN